MSEQTAISMVARGVRASVVRIPQVHDRDKQGVATYMIALAREKGISAYVGAGVNFATEDGCDQVGPLRKVAVHGADADAGLLRDFSHRSVHTGGRKHLPGRLEQRLNVALRVGAHTSIRAVAKLHAITWVFGFVVH